MRKTCRRIWKHEHVTTECEVCNKPLIRVNGFVVHDDGSFCEQVVKKDVKSYIPGTRRDLHITTNKLLNPNHKHYSKKRGVQ